MKGTKQFIDAYNRLEIKNHCIFLIQHYQNDFSSEPFLSIESEVERIALDYVEEHGLIITIFSEEVTLSFSQKNWLSYTGKDYVAFTSRSDGNPYLIIDFR